VYAGGDFGFRATVDAGRTWTTTMRGVVDAMALDPLTPGVVYLMARPPSDFQGFSSLYKSSDRGASWTRLILPGIIPFSSPPVLLLDPSHPQTLYVGWFDDRYQEGEKGGLIRSVDGGTSWTKIFDQPVSGVVLAARRQEMYVSLAGTSAAPCVWRTRDGGQTWASATDGLLSAAAGAVNCQINTLAVDPTKPATLYAGARLNPVAYLTRLNRDGSLNYSTYLPVSAGGVAVAADVNGDAYLAFAAPIVKQFGSYNTRALLMKVSPQPAPKACQSDRADDQRCWPPTHEIRPRR
jgi:hypothetical protein